MRVNASDPNIAARLADSEQNAAQYIDVGMMLYNGASASAKLKLNMASAMIDRESYGALAELVTRLAGGKPPVRDEAAASLMVFRAIGVQGFERFVAEVDALRERVQSGPRKESSYDYFSGWGMNFSKSLDAAMEKELGIAPANNSGPGALLAALLASSGR